jgi:G:T-mismatch repair DNA endonuclease (very short patch repair protein)
MPIGVYVRTEYHKKIAKENCRKVGFSNRGKVGHNTGKHHSNESKKKIGKKSKEIWSNTEYKKRMSEIHKKHPTKYWLGKKRIDFKKLWGNKKFREKMLLAQRNGMKITPNKPERKLNELLTNLFPNEYKINVKGEVMILGGKIPDFINVNGQKKVIEMFGDWFHSKEWIKKHGCYEDTEKGRIKHFKKLGWDTLIVWEHELKDIDKLKEKINIFNNISL